ncbi:hypothetical protein GLW08_00665 [Pontibacillus yanchengensis]|uniref:Uncharacterized protein n=1 Tax=Pontibacillus yanchengensis TaxID=462910 RepID=A0ACC7VC93_9BACI|nr:DUF6020 family protein [Pontibacillus yanchengensis]MYL51841.1 hypothetical protein [Pontibacillus yanchengensis]
MTNLSPFIRLMVSAVVSFIATAGIISFYEPFYPFTMFIGAILFCLFMLLAYRAITSFSWNNSILFSRSYLKWILPFGLIFPVLLMASSAPDQSHIETYFMLMSVYLVTYLVYVCLLFIGIAQLIQLDISGSSSKFSFLVYFVIPFLAWLVYFIAFFPATMTPDSLSQWGQAHSYDWSNWHPLVHTWLLTVLVQIWDSPGVLALFQVFMMALVWAYGMKSIEKQGVSFVWLSLFTVLVAAWPVLGIYSVSLWKDVLYSIVLFLFCVLTFNIVFSRGTWLTQKSNLLLLFITSLGVAFFRHNGFPVFLVMGILLLIVFRKHWKPLCANFIAVLAIYIVVTGPIFSALDVRPTEAKEALGIPTQQMANIVINGDLTEDQEAYVSNVMPLPMWEKFYHPYKVDPIKFSGEYDDTFIANDLGAFLKVWSGMVIQNPGLAMEAFLKETSIVWQMHEPKKPGYTSNFLTYIYKDNEYGLENKIFFPSITSNVKEYLEDSEKNFLTTIWRPASYLFAIVFLTFTAWMKFYKRASMWLISLPVLLNIGSVAATLPAQDFRYLFSNVPVALFLIAMMWIGQTKMRDAHE